MAVRFFCFLVAAALIFVGVATVLEARIKPIGTTRLYEAIRAADVDRVGALLRAGASPNENSTVCYRSSSENARYWESRQEAPLDVALGISQSLEHAAENIPNYTDPSYLDRSLKIVAMLYEAGARSERERKDLVPLHHAASLEAYRTVKVLLACGVDPNQRDKSGRTALHLLAGDLFSSNDGTASYHMTSRARKTMQVLLRSGCRVDGRDQYGRTPLYYACRRGNVTACLVLLAFGADSRAKDIGGMEPIDVAFNKEIEDLLTGKVSIETEPDR